jgi:hypothetical protein
MKKPSVSNLISLLDKPALLHWANNLGLKGKKLSDERKKWLSRGTSIHSQINNFITNGVRLDSEEDQNSLNRFLKDKEVIDSEVSIETEYFVGRYDIRFRYNDRVAIGDFKNGGGTYFETKLQLVAYSMAVNCDDLFVINTPKFLIEETHIKNRGPFVEILKSLSKIYYLKQEIA